ncbi:MAG: Stage V sporulation protein AE (SpoVAE) [Firmicutes bacterium]|nr:Stage V sporulation protein AE (SpoVAE) [Bacillota bacterium]MDI6706439.1 stage V sporulation protein AE [Bacillota bacterium]
MDDKHRIIIVTDGDRIAKRAVETAASQIGGRCISRSAGNPTPLTSTEIIEMIKQAPRGPVVIMVDDRGKPGTGEGEIIIQELSKRSDIEIIGVVAVASNTEEVEGIEVDCSVDNNLNIISSPVDKLGNPVDGKVVTGDTVDVLNDLDVPVIIGVGDPGKMDGKDDCILGAPVLTKALQVIIDRDGATR